MLWFSKNKLLTYVIILLLTFLIENDYNLAFSLEMDPIDEGDNNNTDSEDSVNDNNIIPPATNDVLAEETVGIVVGTMVFLLIIVIFWAVPVKSYVLLPFSNLTFFKITIFIVYLFLSCILDFSYFNMCYLSDQEINLTEIWLDEFAKEEEDMVLLENDEDYDIQEEFCTDWNILDSIIISIAIITAGVIIGSIIVSVIDQ